MGVRLITTIGYGSSAPTTTAGRTFLIVYALVGIIVAGFLLDTISRFALLSVTKLHTMVTKRAKPTSSEELRHLIFLVFFILIVMSAVMAALEQGQREGSAPWTLWEALYFSFISKCSARVAHSGWPRWQLHVPNQCLGSAVHHRPG